MQTKHWMSTVRGGAFSILGVLAVLAPQVGAAGGFSSSGRFVSETLRLSVSGVLESSGEMIGHKAAYISCEEFTGKGTLRSPQIELRAGKFSYTGTIDCSERCVITVREAFDTKMFTRKGGGEFLIVLDPDVLKK